MEKTRKFAKQWVKDRKPCTYQFGFTYKGAEQRPITNEEAKKLIEQDCWKFCMGFYELRWDKYNGQDVLCFNEFHENDLY